MTNAQPRKPPWQAFTYPWTSIGWRMGHGEDYWSDFCDWFRSLNEAQRMRFIVANPEPQDWTHFYEYITADAKRKSELHDAIVEAQREYIVDQYNLGCLCEEHEEYKQAMEHYANVVQRGGFRDARDRYYRLRDKEAT